MMKLIITLGLIVFFPLAGSSPLEFKESETLRSRSSISANLNRRLPHPQSSGPIVKLRIGTQTIHKDPTVTTPAKQEASQAPKADSKASGISLQSQPDVNTYENGSSDKNQKTVPSPTRNNPTRSSDNTASKNRGQNKPSPSPSPVPSSQPKKPQPVTAPNPPTTNPAKGNEDEKTSLYASQQTGEGTFYSPGLGSCGEQHSDTDMIAAVSHELYDTFPGATANPNNNPVCGRNLKIGWKDKWITVKVVDRCEGCLKTDVDLSPGAFAKLEDMSVGRLRGIEWTMEP